MLGNSFIGVLCLFLLGFHYPSYALRCGLQVDDKPVCYYVVSNEIKAYGRENDIFIREISVLMDEADFTEDNLKALMRHFFDKYSEPHWMRVHVATHTSQMYDLYVSEGKGKRPSELHPYGGLHRKDGNEIIRYKLPDSDLKTIVMKGTDWLDRIK